ncbi:unnamed protein product [Ilex paraguariensis]|uniref:Uncharacterized protein n=1 Tax=Ilex paraguariensis TaxID=185542 RepID=A0ABC8RKX0_9AQUA
MSASRGLYRSRAGEDRFYSPPAMRRYNQEKRQSQKLSSTTTKSKSLSVESEKRIESSDDCASWTTTTSFQASPRMSSDLTNLDRLMEHTTPLVPVQHFSKSMRRWRTHEEEFHSYFILGDLWESFGEWSAYGAGVPLMLNGSNSVVQYYVPYLSGIQLYIDPSRPFTQLRVPGEESDSESSRETSTDGDSDSGAESGVNGVEGGWSQQKRIIATIQNFDRVSLRENIFMGSSIGESEISNPPGRLIFEYLEQDQPYSREPLADKISVLASRFPELNTLKSCDLTPASWVSVAWYPIYRIPTGPTLQNIDACFLTFHSLSTAFKSTSTDWPHIHCSTVREVHSAGISSKLSLPIFGLASYKFKVSMWNPNGVYECQKLNSLLQAADNWLQLLQVNHHDYKFFVSHSSYWR